MTAAKLLPMLQSKGLNVRIRAVEYSLERLYPFAQEEFLGAYRHLVEVS